MKIKAIIFDFDGVIIDSIPGHKLLLSKALGRFGIKLTEDDSHRLNGMKTRDAIMWLKDRKHLKISIFKLIKEKKKFMKEIYNYISLFPQVKSCLKRLKKYELAVATSSGRKYLKKNLESFNINNFFKVKLSNNDVKNAKPSPEIFLKAAKELGVKPSECLVIEDAMNGIIAARKAGMKSVAILTTSPKKYFVKDARPDMFIKTLDELTQGLIQTLNKPRKTRS